MKEVFLAAAVLGALIFCYFLMTRLDRFLCVNRKAIEKESEKTEPSCIVLTDAISDEEALEAIHNFKKSHENVRIIVCDGDVKDAFSAQQNEIKSKQ
ncbi:MAG: hypothetical protein PUC29_03335 [Clostridia bacterium]|nr:hypothetical protein [Clostridia bacterium]